MFSNKISNTCFPANAAAGELAQIRLIKTSSVLRWAFRCWRKLLKARLMSEFIKLIIKKEKTISAYAIRTDMLADDSLELRNSRVTA